ncbi:hypothetical protein, partial [Roseateles sp.]|uniref:hypothetical protein n=1 Tax=Roseateles sp. TaxID=1971397 RepID=UPI00391CECCB
MSAGTEPKNTLGPRQYLLATGLAAAVAATMWAAQLEDEGGDAGAAGLAAPTRSAPRPAAPAAAASAAAAAAPAWA